MTTTLSAIQSLATVTHTSFPVLDWRRRQTMDTWGHGAVTGPRTKNRYLSG